MAGQLKSREELEQWFKDNGWKHIEDHISGSDDGWVKDEEDPWTPEEDGQPTFFNDIMFEECGKYVGESYWTFRKSWIKEEVA